ncbi:MAG: S-adenosyl-l-methionine hydroxide adenosyltransferase family protein [Saprospiraceae bacterium]
MIQSGRTLYATLTTDFGDRDYYVGALKGALLRVCPQATLIDITHRITPYDINEAAFVAGNCWREFPAGALHLVGVNCAYAPMPEFVAARVEESFFAAPDNGVLTLMFPHLSSGVDCRRVRLSAKKQCAYKEAFAQIMAHWREGLEWETLGEASGPLVERISLQPVSTTRYLRGAVIHIDHFDNAIVNISRSDFERVADGRPFQLFFKRNDPLTRLSEDYCDVPEGEALCLFNDADMLEIAIHAGKAAALLGLKLGDVVEINFD